MAGKKPLITGYTRAREQQYQERVMIRVSAAIEKPMRLAIASAMAELAIAHGNTRKQSAIMAAHRAAVARILERGYRVAFAKFGTRILNASKKSGRDFERKDYFGGYDDAVSEWISTTTALKVTQIAGTTFEQALGIIAQATGEAISQGLGEAQTGKLIRDTMREHGAAMTVARSRIIARTETHAASQAASQTAAAESGLRLKKEWIAAGGDRTRDDHQDADGQTVGINEDFNVGGEHLHTPGDPNGSAENVINCRCVVGYVTLD